MAAILVLAKPVSVVVVPQITDSSSNLHSLTDNTPNDK